MPSTERQGSILLVRNRGKTEIGAKFYPPIDKERYEAALKLAKRGHIKGLMVEASEVINEEGKLQTISYSGEVYAGQQVNQPLKALRLFTRVGDKIDYEVHDGRVFEYSELSPGSGVSL